MDRIEAVIRIFECRICYSACSFKVFWFQQLYYIYIY